MYGYWTMTELVVLVMQIAMTIILYNFFAVSGKRILVGVVVGVACFTTLAVVTHPGLLLYLHVKTNILFMEMRIYLTEVVRYTLHVVGRLWVVCILLWMALQLKKCWRSIPVPR
jgi:hypothetical protein